MVLMTATTDDISIELGQGLQLPFKKKATLLTKVGYHQEKEEKHQE